MLESCCCPLVMASSVLLNDDHYELRCFELKFADQLSKSRS